MRNKFSRIILAALLLSGFTHCQPNKKDTESKEAPKDSSAIPVIFDTDANNELDDQHAMAYLLFNPETFHVLGITVNTTYNGGNIEEHYAEAGRILKLTNAEVPLKKGADANFEAIRDSLIEDGSEAVEFIVEQLAGASDTVTVIAVGKLTNLALAVNRHPEIIPKLRLVWLGSNYPEPGEYNQVNDVEAMNFLLNQPVHFEMVTVRYGKPSGTDAVRVTPQEINQKMQGAGPVSKQGVTGRHGGTFTTFGDYSVSLFENIDLHGDPPSRALFDMAAVAIVKNPEWAEKKEIPAPIYQDDQWQERPDNPRTIIVWENFDTQAILNDFFATIKKAG